MEIDDFGDIYVVDSVNNSLQKFDPSGFFLGIADLDSLDDGLNSPTAITIEDDILYVTDSQNNRVVSFDTDLVFLEIIGSGELDSPGGIDSSFIDEVPEFYELYVADSANDRIVIFSDFVTSGFIEFDFFFGMTGTGNGEFDNPTSVASDDSGNLYVVDNGNNRVQLFDFGGLFIEKFGSGPGTGNFEFDNPLDVETDGFGLIYIADTGNHRIQVFQSDLSGDTCDFENDFDCDNVPDSIDNCPASWNEDQTDSDGNGIGNECDFGADFGSGMSEIATPPLVVISPGSVGTPSTAETTVTITRTDGTVQDSEIIDVHAFSNNDDCTLIPVDFDTDIALIDNDFSGAPDFTFGSATFKQLKAVWTCTGSPIGDYVSFFDVFANTSFASTILDIFLTVTDPSGSNYGSNSRWCNSWF